MHRCRRIDREVELGVSLFGDIMSMVHSIIEGLFLMQKLAMGEPRVWPEAHLTEDSRSGHPIRTQIINFL